MRKCPRAGALEMRRSTGTRQRASLFDGRVMTREKGDSYAWCPLLLPLWARATTEPLLSEKRIKEAVCEMEGAKRSYICSVTAPGPRVSMDHCMQWSMV